MFVSSSNPTSPRTTITGNKRRYSEANSENKKFNSTLEAKLKKIESTKTTFNDLNDNVVTHMIKYLSPADYPSVRAQCKRLYISTPVRFFNIYKYDEIQLMRAFETTLKKFNIKIKTQFLRAILPEILMVKTCFNRENADVNFIKYLPLSLNQCQNMMFAISHNLFIKNEAWSLQMNIRDQKCTEIELKESNDRGYDNNRFSKKVLREDKRNIIINDRYNKIDTCELLKDTKGNTYHNWKRENSVVTCELCIHKNGNTYHNWKLENGVETCELLRDTNGNTLHNYKRENGVETCELFRHRNGNTYHNWKDENGVLTFELFRHRNGNTYHNCKEDENGVESCDTLTTPDGCTYHQWKDENGVETCKTLTITTGHTCHNWKRENGVETCDTLTVLNGNTYHNWKYENGVETCDTLITSEGTTYHKWKCAKNGTQTCGPITKK